MSLPRLSLVSLALISLLSSDTASAKIVPIAQQRSVYAGVWVTEDLDDGEQSDSTIASAGNFLHFGRSVAAQISIGDDPFPYEASAKGSQYSSIRPVALSAFGELSAHLITGLSFELPGDGGAGEAAAGSRYQVDFDLTQGSGYHLGASFTLWDCYEKGRGLDWLGFEVEVALLNLDTGSTVYRGTASHVEECLDGSVEGGVDHEGTLPAGRYRFQATASVDGRRYATATPGYLDLRRTYGMAFQLKSGTPIPESNPIAAPWTLAAVAGWITRQRRRTGRQSLPPVLRG